jgi:RTC4-like domain
MNRMSPVLRSAARHDPIVRKSPVQYMMQVLVPAVVVRLIMEDMKQDEKTALETLKNGTSLGMFFHEVDESW